jgi:RNA polymerase sigma factor (sigma-70 family)
MQTLDDQKHLKASLSGKPESFGILVQRYQSFVCALTYSAVGDLEKSEELAQEIFILAWNNLSQLKDLSKFKNWLYSIAKNHIRRFFQKQKHDIISGAAQIAAADSIGTLNENPVLRAISKESQQQVWDALCKIPLQYRAPLVLYYREEKSIRQVAHFFEITESAAKKRLSRARGMLRESIERDLERTLRISSPSSQFSASVVGLIAAGTLATATASASAATGISVAGSKGGAGWLTAWMSGLGGKIVIAASVVVVTLSTASSVLQQQKRQKHQKQQEQIEYLQELPPSLQDGLVMYLSFDYIEEYRGRDMIIDESYRGNDGILMGGKFVKGKIGNALNCQAKNKSGGVIVQDHDSLDLDAVTIVAWIKTDHIDNQWNRILDKGWKTAYNLCIGGEYQGNIFYSNRAQFECVNKGLTSNTPVADNQWHLVVGSYDGYVLRLYIDGKRDRERSYQEISSLKHNNVDIHIGMLAVPEPPPYNEPFFDGLIDEVRLYNRVLTDKEIFTLYRYQPEG